MNIEITVPDNKKGDYKIETFEVSESEAKLYNIRASVRGGRYILPGVYKRLMRGDTVMMSNTPSEIQDHLQFISKARGNVLINGLGFGMALKAVLNKPEVTSVTIVEVSPDIIDLVGPSYNKDPRVQIINADCFEYKPPRGSRYQAVWHDIWDYICGDNVEEMDKLMRKYRSRTEWQGCWCRKECLRQNKGGFLNE